MYAFATQRGHNNTVTTHCSMLTWQAKSTGMLGLQNSWHESWHLWLCWHS